MDKEKKLKHELILEDRNNINISGIKEVINYNEENIKLKSTQGNLNIQGKKLNIKKLNLEETTIIIEGYVTELKYQDKKDKSSFIKKLLSKSKK